VLAVEPGALLFTRKAWLSPLEMGRHRLAHAAAHQLVDRPTIDVGGAASGRDTTDGLVFAERVISRAKGSQPDMMLRMRSRSRGEKPVRKLVPRWPLAYRQLQEPTPTTVVPPDLGRFAGGVLHEVDEFGNSRCAVRHPR
jgi:hypothetical protein